MHRSWTLSAKLALTGVCFLLLALASTGATLWVVWKLEGGAAAVNEAGRMRMQTYRLALAVATPVDPAERRRLAREFDQSLERLVIGDPARPLFVPWSDPTRALFQELRGGWQVLRGRWLATTPPARIGAEADAFVATVDRFVAAIEAEIAGWTGVLRAVQFAVMGLAIASAVALLYAGYLLVLAPLGRLKRGLEAVQRGDLQARVAVEGNDEFGELAAGFNAMTQTLEALYGTLEHKVQEKTRRLEVKRRRLAALYEVSAFVARAPTLEALAQGFARHLRRVAGADAAAVRWLAEGNQRFVMLAGDGLPPEFTRAEACLEASACACGQPAATAATRVIPITPAAATPLPHCGRAGFRTVVSLPVRLHEKLLAEVSLFYRAPFELPQGERHLLETLGTHLAGAMEGLRAAAIEREAAVSEERSLLARELHDSIAQSLAFMKIQVQLLRQASQRRDAQAVERITDELDAGVRESYADVRELLLHFRTRASGDDMASALRVMLQKFEHQSGLPAHLAISGTGLPLGADVQVQVLHILQEALSNVRKHARASHVELRVEPGPRWRFEVLDDGGGFDPSAPAPDSTHVGLRIMQERAQRIHATLSIDATPEGGCRVRLDVPAAGAGAALPHAEEALA